MWTWYTQKRQTLFSKEIIPSGMANVEFCGHFPVSTTTLSCFTLTWKDTVDYLLSRIDRKNVVKFLSKLLFEKESILICSCNMALLHILTFSHSTWLHCAFPKEVFVCKYNWKDSQIVGISVVTSSFFQQWLFKGALGTTWGVGVWCLEGKLEGVRLEILCPTSLPSRSRCLPQ